MSTTQTRWTLVTLRPRARFARPVGGAPVGTWDEVYDSRALCSVLEGSEDRGQVWVVPTEGAASHEEDMDNILLDNGRRVPIRWDAKPDYLYPTDPPRSEDTMTRYLATINTPGYLPMSDEPAVFDTVREAWDYLAAEREASEDYACDEECEDGPACRWGFTHDYTDTVRDLYAMTLVGTVVADTPGYHGSHDLGVAYSVEALEHANYPHHPGYLPSCVACEHGPCVCSSDPEHLAPCVSSTCERSDS
jgi:hypothetical protein